MTDRKMPSSLHETYYRKAVETLKAENKRLREAIEAIIDFHNAPRQAQRPDFYQILLRRAVAALQEQGEETQ